VARYPVHGLTRPRGGALECGQSVPAIVFKETQAAGRTLGIEVQSLEVRGPDDFDGAFEAARKQRPDALITVEESKRSSCHVRPMAEAYHQFG
jgi:hypothetical protein